MRTTRILRSTCMFVLASADAFAQQSSGLDISGSWFDLFFQEPARTASGMLVEYPGIPINDAGRNLR